MTYLPAKTLADLPPIGSLDGTGRIAGSQGAVRSGSMTLQDLAAWMAPRVNNLNAAAVINDPTGFQVPGGVARSVAGRLAETVSVADFGAKGDGSTIDGPALQAAFTFAAANKKRVFIPNTGSAYLINQRLIIPNGLDLECEPDATIKVANGATLANGLYWAIGNEATISARHTGTRIVGLTLDLNRLGNVDYGAATGSGNSQYGYEGVMLAGLCLANIDGLVVKQCIVKNATASGIWIVDCPWAVIRDNIAQDCRFSGISIRQYQWTGPLPAGLCTGNRLARCTVGIHPGIFGLTAGNFFGNYAEECGDFAKWPSTLYAGTYPNVWPLTGTYKHYGDAGYVSPAVLGDGAGFEFSGYFSGPSSGVVAGADREQHMAIGPNTATRCQFGLRLEQGCQHVSVVGGNYFANIMANIFLFSATDVVLSGVSADQSAGFGISIQSIADQDQTARVSLVGCSARDNGNMALNISGASHVNVLGGQYGGSGGGTGAVKTEIGVFATGGFYCSAITIRGIDVEGSAASWVYSDSTSHTDIEIIDSQFRGSPTAQIAGAGASNVVISGCGGITSQGIRRMGVAVVPGLQVGNTDQTIQLLSGSGVYGAGLRAYGSADAGQTSFDTNANRGWAFTTGSYAAYQMIIAGPANATAYPEINSGVSGLAGITARPQGAGNSNATLVLGRSGTGIIRLDYTPATGSNNQELASTAWVRTVAPVHGVALPSYASDGAAATGGVVLYGYYWNTATGAVAQRRA